MIHADRDRIFFLTCKHVVQKDIFEQPELGSSIYTYLKDEQGSWTSVAGYHHKYDLALLQSARKFGSEEKPPPNYTIPIRDFDSIIIGERVFIIGHPLGFAYSLSDGVIAQKRGMPDSRFPLGFPDYPSDGDVFLQFSAPISPGNSGGPVFDMNGRLAGVAAMGKPMIERAQNLNFAVRADAVFDIKRWKLTDEGEKALKTIAEVHGKGENN